MTDDDDTPRPPDSEDSSPEPEVHAGAQRPNDEPTDTDAFAEGLKNAAKQVLEEKLGVVKHPDGRVEVAGLDSEAMKQGAQALVMSLIQQLAAGAATQRTGTKTSAPDDNVIDLDHARQQRDAGAGASVFETRIGDELKGAFDDYLRQHFVPDGATGNVDVNLDSEVLKQHGPALATALFGAFTKAVIPQDGLSVSVPLSEPTTATDDNTRSTPEDGPAQLDDAKAGGDEPIEVKLNVDVAGLFRGLLDKAKAPTREP